MNANLEQVQQLYLAACQASGPPAVVTLNFYDSAEAMALPGESADRARFLAACRVTADFVTWLELRGQAVATKYFKRAEYDRWRAARPDTRALRAEFAGSLPPGRRLRLRPGTADASRESPWEEVP